MFDIGEDVGCRSLTFRYA